MSKKKKGELMMGRWNTATFILEKSVGLEHWRASESRNPGQHKSLLLINSKVK